MTILNKKNHHIRYISSYTYILRYLFYEYIKIQNMYIVQVLLKYFFFTTTL